MEAEVSAKNTELSKQKQEELGGKELFRQSVREVHWAQNERKNRFAMIG
jgi:hypothetical protein